MFYKINDVVESKKFELAITSRTAQLWINFMDYIGVIRIFITAARTGDKFICCYLPYKLCQMLTTSIATHA